MLILSLSIILTASFLFEADRYSKTWRTKLGVFLLGLALFVFIIHLFGI